jgi:hypothetical protein
MGHKVLSKHDSFLIPKKEKDSVFGFVKNELESILGKDCFILREPIAKSIEDTDNLVIIEEEVKENILI